MKRKEHFREIIVDALASPTTPWMNHKEMAILVGIPSSTLKQYFSAAEFAEIENDGLIKRRQKLRDVRRGYTSDILDIDKTVLRKAKSGSLGHAQLAYERFEGPVTSKLEVTGKDGDPLFSPERLLAELLKKEEPQS